MESASKLQLTLPVQLVDLEKIGRDEERFTDELQRNKAEKWHPTFRSLISSVLFVLFVSFALFVSFVVKRYPQTPGPNVVLWNNRGEPKRRITRNLKSTSIAAARLPWSFAAPGINAQEPLEVGGVDGS